MNNTCFISFYKDVVCRKAYFVPVLFFSIVSYSYSIYNRTVSIDDILRRDVIEDCPRSRWGGYVFFNALGITEFDPFIDRFLAVLFYVLTATLLSYLFYCLSKIKEVWVYAITSSFFITYPLVNEIWEYTTANGSSGCWLLMVTLAVIILRSNLSILKRYLISIFLLLIPIAGYEISISYYASLICVILFYEYNQNNVPLIFHKWIKQNLYYFVPVVLAIVLRFVISFIYLNIFDLEYASFGDTHITWLGYNFMPTLKGMLVSNFIHYIVLGLVYFPITIFVVALLCFIVYLFCCQNKFRNVALGCLLIMSLFLQAIFQGDLLAYRHSVTITLFVSFVVFLLCTTIKCSTINLKTIYILFLGICWYQAVYLNRLLGLNNLRSDNELAIIRQIGILVESKFDKKTLVVVSGYKTSSWINRQITVDSASWGGNLFYSICSFLSFEPKKPYKFIGTNVNTATSETIQVREIFNYCGFDIDVIPSQYSLFDLQTAEHERDVILEASKIAKEKKLKPYQIYDNGKYLITNLGGESFAE